MGKGTSKVGAVGTGFKEGDTPKAIDPDAIYSVSKVSGATGKATDYGNLTGEDIKPMLKGYKYNGLFWEKNGSMTAYDVVLRKKGGKPIGNKQTALSQDDKKSLQNWKQNVSKRMKTSSIEQDERALKNTKQDISKERHIVEELGAQYYINSGYIKSTSDEWWQEHVHTLAVLEEEQKWVEKEIKKKKAKSKR